MLNFEKFDGTERRPRELQTQVFNWLASKYREEGRQVLAANLPPGIGKSAILRAIQIALPGKTVAGIIPSNALIEQYERTYPDLNIVKGLDHYACQETEGLTCRENRDIGGKCPECTSTTSRNRAAAGEPTVFNPMSFHIFSKFYDRDKSYQPDVLVIDEAHKLTDGIMLMADLSLPASRYGSPPDSTDYQKVKVWLQELDSKIGKLLSRYAKDIRSEIDDKKIAALRKKIDQSHSDRSAIHNILYILNTDSQNCVFYSETKGSRKYFTVKPLFPPKHLLSAFLGAKKLVLMSATLFPSDLHELGEKVFEYIDLDSPIASDRRQILYQPSQLLLNFRTEPPVMAAYIGRILEKYKDQNAIVHLSYAWAEKLKPFFPGAHVHTPSTKIATMKKFKSTGGLWLAAGCSEGVDLPGDECRLVVIPVIIRKPVQDPFTAKRLSLEGGQTWYDMECLKTVIQQAGRATRGETDYSVTVVCDPSFPRLVTKYKYLLPKSFLSSIKWST